MTDRPPGDFGRKLREARERRGVSLRQIANATKITVSALEALERNDIVRLPGGIFSRAFVRSYAIEVGLDPEATIQEFMAQFPHDSVTAGHPASKHIEDHEAIESDRRTATTFVRLIALSIPFAGAVLYFGMAGRPASLVSPGTAAAVPKSASSGPLAPISARLPAAAPGGRAAADAPDPSAAADRFTVALSATRECWVSATVDGDKAIEGLMQPGEQRTMEVLREMVLTAGDAGAIAMTLNGVEAKPLGKQGEAVTARLNLSNFREYLSRP